MPWIPSAEFPCSPRTTYPSFFNLKVSEFPWLVWRLFFHPYIHKLNPCLISLIFCCEIQPWPPSSTEKNIKAQPILWSHELCDHQSVVLLSTLHSTYYLLRQFETDQSLKFEEIHQKDMKSWKSVFHMWLGHIFEQIHLLHWVSFTPWPLILRELWYTGPTFTWLLLVHKWTQWTMDWH